MQSSKRENLFKSQFHVAPIYYIHDKKLENLVRKSRVRNLQPPNLSTVVVPKSSWSSSFNFFKQNHRWNRDKQLLFTSILIKILFYKNIVSILHFILMYFVFIFTVILCQSVRRPTFTFVRLLHFTSVISHFHSYIHMGSTQR